MLIFKPPGCGQPFHTEITPVMCGDQSVLFGDRDRDLFLPVTLSFFSPPSRRNLVDYSPKNTNSVTQTHHDPLMSTSTSMDLLPPKRSLKALGWCTHTSWWRTSTLSWYTSWWLEERLPKYPHSQISHPHTGSSWSFYLLHPLAHSLLHDLSVSEQSPRMPSSRDFFSFFFFFWGLFFLVFSFEDPKDGTVVRIG